MDQPPVQHGASIAASCRMQPPVDHLGTRSHAATPNPESRALKLRWLHFDGGTNQAIEQKLDSGTPKSRFAGSDCASERQAWRNGAENSAGGVQFYGSSRVQLADNLASATRERAGISQ
jgi:hypothetical protein